jgi:hypothetical protein
MLRIGLPLDRLITVRKSAAGHETLWVAMGALSAAVPALWMWGFTVDDALISVRYAQHLSLGLGFRFNASGPSTDGVTPLAWPFLLAPLARGDGLVVLARAKVFGFVAWLATGAALGRAVGRVKEAPPWARAATLVVVALSVPLAAHAVSGMETALATLLATGAALSVGRPRSSAVLAGLASSLRPEMAPWACVLAVGLSIAARASAPRVAAAALLSLGPFVVCALVREVAWGYPAPLALWAKPSDVDHGVRYAGAALVVTVVPLLVLAPGSLRRSPAAMAIVAAASAHALAIVVVGGDWMPYARLMVPVVPSLAYAAILVSAHAPPAATATRCLSAAALGTILIARGGTAGRSVGADRAALVLAGRPWLANVPRVAALDVGWVGAATARDVIDLAGVTDPEVAVLAGGHTSKRIGAMFLLGRDPGVLLLYAPFGLPGGRQGEWRQATYPRVVEARLAHDDVIARHFTCAGWLPLGANGAGYVVLRRAGIDSREPRPVLN